MTSKQIVVVGAGIVGASCALALQRKGHAVTIVDSREPGDGCSFGNAGNISPGSVVPYSIPGSLRKLPKWLFDPSGPLSIRPSYFLRFMPWGLRWLAASRREAATRISQAMHLMHGGSLEAYAQLLRESGNASLVRMSGQLYASRIPGKAHGSEVERELRRAAGVRLEFLDGGQLREIEPTIGPQFHSGLWLPDNGNCVNPQRLVRVIAGLAVAQGATLVRQEMRAFAMDEGRVRGVSCADGTTLKADLVVLAAGAWSGRLLAQLGTRVPLEAERGYHVTLTDPGVIPKIPTADKDSGFATAPMEMGLRVAGTAEYAGLDAPPRMARARMLLAQAQALFPGVRVAAHTSWMGCRPSLPDGLPILDRPVRHPGLITAFGNSHFGLSASPRMSQVVAALASDEPPPIDISAFRMDRFGQSERRAEISL